MEPEYDEPHLVQMLRLASRLGFQDDVAHWRRKLAALRAKQDEAR